MGEEEWGEAVRRYGVRWHGARRYRVRWLWGRRYGLRRRWAEEVWGAMVMR